MEQEKIFLIGLDAADPNLLAGWIKNGDLPFFKQLLEESSYGEIACIPPTFSPVEWTSIMTGTNPGKHGIFGFTKPVDQGRRVKIINSTDRKVQTFYDLLSAAGKRVGLINMVMTYPASPIDGFMITGMETPSLEAADISFPPGLITELQEAGIDYHISPGISGMVMQGKLAEAEAALHDAINGRYQAMQYLMEKYDPEVMIVLFSQIDNGGHYFWSLHDQYHAEHDPQKAEQFGNVMLKLYQRHEEILQELMHTYPEAAFVVCSDHGMGFNFDARYYLKALFTQMGWYEPAAKNNDGFHSTNIFLHEIKNLYWFIYKRFSMKQKQRLAKTFPGLRSRIEAMVANVSWEKTRLYSNDDFFSIVINQVDENGLPRFKTNLEYEEFRDEVIEKLLVLRSLDENEPLVKHVFKREEIYEGDWVDLAPDIIIEWADVRINRGIYLDGVEVRADAMQKSDLQKVLSGEHRSKGILFLKGSMFKQGLTVVGNSVLDIAPTILYLAGLPVPQDIDGHVILDAFYSDFQAKYPLQYSDEAIDYYPGEAFDYSEESEEEVWKRLQGLGYVE